MLLHGDSTNRRVKTRVSQLLYDKNYYCRNCTFLSKKKILGKIFENQCIHSFVLTNSLICIVHLKQHLNLIIQPIFNYDEWKQMLYKVGTREGSRSICSS